MGNEGEVLPPDLILHPHEGGTVSVSEILSNPDKWHGKRFADPIEPDYGNDPRIALAVLKGVQEPYIYSHAHHGVRYYFRTPQERDEAAGQEFGKVDDNEALVTEVTERFTVIDAEDFTSAPEQEWIIEGVLPESDLAMIYGESGGGKTFFVLDMLACVALGIPWRSLDVKQGRVVYVAAEGAGGVVGMFCEEALECIWGNELPILQASNPENYDLYLKTEAADKLACQQFKKKQISSEEFKLKLAEHDVAFNNAVNARDAMSRPQPNPFMAQQIMNITNGLTQNNQPVTVPQQSHCRSLVTGQVIDTTCY